MYTLNITCEKWSKQDMVIGDTDNRSVELADVKLDTLEDINEIFSRYGVSGLVSSDGIFSIEGEKESDGGIVIGYVHIQGLSENDCARLCKMNNF